jgi:hypothetical protein
MSHLCANHINGGVHPYCTTPALAGLDYCAAHLEQQDTYCPVQCCTRCPVDELNMLCGPHQVEWEASGLSLQKWAATRHNPLVLARNATKKANGAK